VVLTLLDDEVPEVVEHKDQEQHKEESQQVLK